MQKYVTFFHHEIFFVQKYQNEKNSHILLSKESKNLLKTSLNICVTTPIQGHVIKITL